MNRFQPRVPPSTTVIRSLALLFHFSILDDLVIYIVLVALVVVGVGVAGPNCRFPPQRHVFWLDVAVGLARPACSGQQSNTGPSYRQTMTVIEQLRTTPHLQPSACHGPCSHAFSSRHGFASYMGNLYTMPIQNGDDGLWGRPIAGQRYNGVIMSKWERSNIRPTAFVTQLVFCACPLIVGNGGGRNCVFTLHTNQHTKLNIQPN